MDGLFDAGYEAVTVLDLAPTALFLAQQRIGPRTERGCWLAANVLDVPLPAATYAI